MAKDKSFIVQVAPGKPATANSPATGPEYRSAIAPDGPPTISGVNSLYDMFMSSVEKYPDNKCLGRRSGDAYTWLTYKQTADAAAAIGSAMAHVGVGPHSRAGVYGANSPEWMISMQACNRMSVYCIPLYDSLGENAIEFIINHSESTLVFVQASKLPELIKALPKVKNLVKNVVYWGGDASSAASVKAVKDVGLGVFSFEEFTKLGQDNMKDAVPSKATDLCTIMYTSGTTGDPKGVMITHQSILDLIASMNVFIKSIDIEGGLTELDSFFSFLPLAHIFDRTTEEYMLYLGASIGYWQGDIKLLVDDIAACQPTLFCGVPRVFDRIYAGVISAVQGGSFVKRTLFNWGYSRKLHNLNQGYTYDQAAPMFDKIVFSKVKARLGGKVKLIVSGGAPLARHVEDFLRVCMCCRVVQGYGLTETCAGSFIANPDAPDHFGTVGPVLPVLSMRLDAVPEMNYDPNATPPRGEVCVRGPAVFTGYYKDDEKTKEVLESDGWFHTGDIGELTSSGALKIIDRKKNIFKLAQGEYIAVEKVEGIYKKNTGVEQIWVYGDSFKSALVAVVVPTEAHLKAIAKEAGVATDGGSSSSAELCANPAVVKAFLADLTATAKEGKLKGFEIARALHLTMDQFTVENDLLTPSYKLKRPHLQKKYQPQIDTMYNALGDR